MTEPVPSRSGVGFAVQTGRYRLDGVKRMIHEPTPWAYERNDPRYAWSWSYTLLVYHGGFMQRIYDWQGRPRRVL